MQTTTFSAGDAASDPDGKGDALDRSQSDECWAALVGGRQHCRSAQVATEDLRYVTSAGHRCWARGQTVLRLSLSTPRSLVRCFATAKYFHFDDGAARRMTVPW